MGGEEEGDDEKTKEDMTRHEHVSNRQTMHLMSLLNSRARQRASTQHSTHPPDTQKHTHKHAPVAHDAAAPKRQPVGCSKVHCLSNVEPTVAIGGVVVVVVCRDRGTVTETQGMVTKACVKCQQKSNTVDERGVVIHTGTCADTIAGSW